MAINLVNCRCDYFRKNRIGLLIGTAVNNSRTAAALGETDIVEEVLLAVPSVATSIA